MITKDEYGLLNVYAKEPPIYITEKDMRRYEEQTHAEKAELWNSRTAMVGVVLGLLSYAITGHLFFGVY